MRSVRVKVYLVGLSVMMAGLMVGVPSAQAAGRPARGALPAATAAGPTCTFDGSSLELVTGVKAGGHVVIACSGLPILHPYLVLETSLLLGIDPKAAPLLSGDIVSLAGLDAALAALPEINPLAVALVTSSLTGTLDYTYTVPTSQASDPNATCPPPTVQFNSGLIGCGLAMIDLTSFKPVGAGSAVLQYVGEPALPPPPTMSLSTSNAVDGKSVAVHDATGAHTYWWLSTLYALEGLLGGRGGPGPTVTVTLTNLRTKATITAPNTITVAPATYTEPTFTPPALSGSFVVPSKLHGKFSVTVTYAADLLSFPLSNSVTVPLHIRK